VYLRVFSRGKDKSDRPSGKSLCMCIICCIYPYAILCFSKTLRTRRRDRY
jgi:hypothetical protein